MTKQSSIDHLFHVWINQRQDQGRGRGEAFEHSLYEWKDALLELQRLPFWLKRARTNALPVVHQQCSRQEPEPIAENRLVCALGVEVTGCPILASLYALFAEKAERIPFYGDVTADDADTVAAKVCTWHIFTSVQARPVGSIDTSEGYMQDESDRRFWANTYANMSAADEVSE